MSSGQAHKGFANLEEANWVREMKAHFARTGRFRATDLHRALGDASAGVSMGDKKKMREDFLKRGAESSPPKK